MTTNPESLLAVTQEEIAKTILDQFEDGGGCVEGPDWSWDAKEAKKVANSCAALILATRPAPPAQTGREEVVGDYNPRAAYDECSDVLYVSLFDPPRPAICTEAECRVLFRFDEKTLVGMTVVDFLSQAIATPAAEPLLARQDVRPEADLVERFEAWWETSSHKNQQPAGYGIKKVIAFEAYQAALSTLPTEPASVRENVEREIVAWLRDQSADKQDREWMGPLDIADAIERGEHRAALSTEEPKL